MTTIKNTVIDTRASILAQQFAKRAPLPANPPGSALATASPASAQTDTANPYAALVEFMNKWKDAQQAIERMSNSAQDIRQSRKAVAAEMVRRLKEQLRIMMSMMAGMDPKTKARLIAQMAHELAAAVREYAAASGGNAQENAAVTADSAVARNNNAASSDSKQSALAGAASANTETVPSSAGTPEANAESAATATSPIPTASPAETAGTPQQAGEAIRGKLAEYSQNAASPDSKADQEFIAEVKKLAAQLKALAKQNEVHSQKYPEKSTERETASTLDALKEVESSLASIEPANAAVTTSINVVVK